MNAANILTLSRIVLAPIYAWMFITGYRAGSPGYLWAALGVICLVELTDFLDGRLARGQGKVTDFGKLVDPMADSLARQTMILSFMYCRMVPLWMFLVFFYRDAMMSTLRTMCAAHGHVQAAKMSGKLKAVLQAIGIFVMTALAIAGAQGWLSLPRKVWGMHWGFWVMLLPAAWTFISAFDYFIPNRAVIGKTMQPKRERID